MNPIIPDWIQSLYDCIYLLAHMQSERESSKTRSILITANTVRLSSTHTHTHTHEFKEQLIKLLTWVMLNGLMKMHKSTAHKKMCLDMQSTGQIISEPKHNENKQTKSNMYAHTRNENIVNYCECVNTTQKE